MNLIERYGAIYDAELSWQSGTKRIKVKAVGASSVRAFQHLTEGGPGVPLTGANVVEIAESVWHFRTLPQAGTPRLTFVAVMPDGTEVAFPSHGTPRKFGRDTTIEIPTPAVSASSQPAPPWASGARYPSARGDVPFPPALGGAPDPSVNTTTTSDSYIPSVDGGGGGGAIEDEESGVPPIILAVGTVLVASAAWAGFALLRR